MLAYGFLSRFAGDVQRGHYRMPSSVHAPLQHFQMHAIALWPDVFSDEGLLLSVKVQTPRGLWRERLLQPEPLSRYTPPVKFETAREGCVPPQLRLGPGRFDVFVGETPLSWHALTPAPSAAIEGCAPGPVAVRWSGALRGLLLLGVLC